jgi:trehalose-phosphatase
VSKYLLKNIEYLGGLIEGKKLSLFLDYDGTLTPIVGRPEGARLPFQIKELLRVLSSLYPTVIISGRGLGDIRDRVSLKGMVYAGNHGMEVWSEDFTMVFDPGGAAKEELKRLLSLFKALPRSFPGVIVENKGATLSIHYRLLDTREVRPFVKKLREVTGPSLEKGLVRVTEGKKVFEIRPPVSWHKGRVVEWILKRRIFSSSIPIYVGDDETDKDGFRAIRGRGFSVFVGGAEKEADFFLKAQDEVKLFLGWLKEFGRAQ